MKTALAYAIIAAAFSLAGLPAGHALDNGLARTPPMGWNSWNKYACKGLNELVVRATADTMAANGMKDAGYQYVNIDDCWQIGRDANGNITIDPEKFPSGIKALADYIHGGPPRQHRPRISGRPPVRRMGRRLPQGRLVQHLARPER